MLSLGVDNAVNLTAPTTSPVNLAMPRLLSVREASSCPPGPTQPQVPDVTTSGAARSTWAATNSFRPQQPASKTQTVTSPWSFASGSQALRPRSSTSLTGARQLQTATTTTTDSIPPLRIARPQHLQAQMKQALNPNKLSVVRSTAASFVTSKTSSTGSHPSRLERNDGAVAGSGATVAVSRDSGRISSVGAPQSSKLHAAKSAAGANSDQSALVALKLAGAERRPSNDAIPVNTLKVDNVFSQWYCTPYDRHLLSYCRLSVRLSDCYTVHCC